jgi:cyclophilin family peptidyl-prolyl cis-trans isomerase/HEAT repeat protein
MRMGPCLALSVTACAAFQKNAPPPPPRPLPTAAPLNPFDEIDGWEDGRSLGGGRLVQLALSAADPKLRARGFLALARIQDPATAAAVVQGLKDPEATVRLEAAFAVGQLGLSWDPPSKPLADALTGSLLDAEAAERDPGARIVELESLGKLGTPPALQRLVERLGDGSPDARSRAALSLGTAAKRGAALPAPVIAALMPLLIKEATPAEHFSAAYALALSKSSGARAGLLICTQDALAEVRSLGARGLGDSGAEADAVVLQRLLADPDYRVAVEAVRALVKLAQKCKGGRCAPVGALAELSARAERLERGDTAGGGQPLLALAQQPQSPLVRPVLTALRAELANGAKAAPLPIQRDIAWMDCRLAAALDRLTGSLAEVLDCGRTLVPEASRLQVGLAELTQSPAADRGARAKDVAAYLKHSDSRVVLAALGALAENGSAAATEQVRALIAGKDPVLAAAAARAAAKMGDAASLPAIRALAATVPRAPDLAENVADALIALKPKEPVPELQSWLKATNAHVRSEAARVLNVEVPRVEGAAAPRLSLPAAAALTLETDRGEIRIELDGEAAPRTSVNIFQLVKRGFFKGLSFHRVVPDFVVQGGDPRGDGEGGPGYNIRCEVNHRPYVRGAVGMALSGKDTGGSQFFIATSPQPHLEGRYTVFGQVASGMEVVDALMEGDRIVDVRATP